MWVLLKLIVGCSLKELLRNVQCLHRLTICYLIHTHPYNKHPHYRSKNVQVWVLLRDSATGLRVSRGPYRCGAPRPVDRSSVSRQLDLHGYNRWDFLSLPGALRSIHWVFLNTWHYFSSSLPQINSAVAEWELQLQPKSENTDTDACAMVRPSIRTVTDTANGPM